MAYTYTVVDERDEDMEFTGEKDSLKITWNKSYAVEVAATAGEDIAAVSIYNVITATGLPKVNRSIYTSAGNIIPYVVCRSKSAKRDPKRLSRYIVSTKWSTGLNDDGNESDNEPQAKPAAVTNIAPRVESTLGEVELVRYQDKSDDNKPCITPTGNLFDEPFVERIPTLELKITQYEPSITFAQMLSRKLKVNESTYRGEDRYKWLISDVEAHEADVTLAGDVVVSSALVTYTLSYSPFTHGWKDDRALIDTHHIVSGKKRAYRDDENRTLTYGFISITGVDKGEGADPDYDQWEMYDTINFSTFLRA